VGVRWWVVGWMGWGWMEMGVHLGQKQTRKAQRDVLQVLCLFLFFLLGGG